MFTATGEPESDKLEQKVGGEKLDALVLLSEDINRRFEKKEKKWLQKKIRS